MDRWRLCAWPLYKNLIYLVLRSCEGFPEVNKMKTSESYTELRRLNGLSLDTNFIANVFSRQMMALPTERRR